MNEPKPDETPLAGEPAAPAPDSDDDANFEERLRRAVVRHYRHQWREIARLMAEARKRPRDES